MKHYLVTGGAGFVGSVLARELIKIGAKVTIVDDLSNGKRENLPKEARFVEGDLSLASTYDNLGSEKFDAIFHLAAQASNAISFDDPYRDLAANQIASLRLLEFSVKVGCKRFLFASSMSVYGQPKEFPTPESVAPKPDSFYAVHKAAVEQYLRIFEDQHGLQWTAFRLYTTYGSGQNLENIRQGLLSIYLAYLVKKKPISVMGSLERKRDIVHVNDVVHAMLLALENSKSYSKIYNLCSGETRTIRELLDRLITEAGEDPKRYPVEELPKTKGDPFETHGSFESAKRDLGFTPSISPEEGICLTVKGLK